MGCSPTTVSVAVSTCRGKLVEGQLRRFKPSVSGLVVKSIVAIDGPRVRFAADAFFFSFFFHVSH